MLKDPRQSYWSQAHTSFVHSKTRAGTPGQHVAFGCTFCWPSLLGHSLLFGGLRALRAFGAMGADCTSCDAVGNLQTCQYTTNNRYLTGIPGMLCIVAVKPAGGPVLGALKVAGIGDLRDTPPRREREQGLLLSTVCTEYTTLEVVSCTPGTSA